MRRLNKRSDEVYVNNCFFCIPLLLGKSLYSTAASLVNYVISKIHDLMYIPTLAILLLCNECSPPSLDIAVAIQVSPVPSNRQMEYNEIPSNM